MALKIRGGVANQPDIPSVSFGYGRNSGWWAFRGVEDGISRPLDEATSSVVVNIDRVEEVFTAGLLAVDQTLEVTIYPRPGGSVPEISITGGGSVVIDPDIPMTLRSVFEGTEKVTLSGDGRSTEFTVESRIVPYGAAPPKTLAFVSSYLSHHCEAAVNSRISGATTAMLPIFQNFNASHASGNYTRNPNCWAYDLSQKLTCVSPWNSRQGHLRAGTALTPRHIGLARHYDYGAGTTVRFVTADNQTITRTVTHRVRHPIVDITICLLDSDLPSSITPCKVLPQNFGDYFPTGPRWVAALCLDQEEKALVTDLSRFGNVAQFRYPNLPYEQILYEDKIAGDSSNPAFLIINDELVCLCFWTWGGWGAGRFLTAYLDDINQMISDLDSAAGISTGYTLETADLSSFPIVF